MDGTLAVIFVMFGFADMVVNDCPRDCLAPGTDRPQWNYQAGDVQFQERSIAKEVYLGYDTGETFGPFETTVGGSISTDGDAWVGYGAKWTSQDVINSPFYIETSLMPGLHARGDGPDLGSVLQFRSSFGFGYAFDNGATLKLLYDHRSNADIVPVNPGLETLALRFSYPVR